MRPNAGSRNAGSRSAGSRSASAVVAAAALFAVVGGGLLPRVAHAQELGADAAKASAEALAVALREYVYASYDVTLAGDDEALGRLQATRGLMVAAIEKAGLGAVSEDTKLWQLVPELRSYFEVASRDLVFLPSGPRSGVTLVRASERREVPERNLAGRLVTYRVIAWDEVVIEDLARYRSGGEGAPIAAARGRTIYLDLQAARRTGRERILLRARVLRKLAERAREGGRLTPVQVKDLLRFRALARAVSAGEAELGVAIADAEETRLAALFAAAGDQDAAEVTEYAALARLSEEAVLRAAAIGDPRYQLASAIALTLAAPESPTADGARRAIRALAGKDGLARLPALSIGELRKRARAGLRELEKQRELEK